MTGLERREQLLGIGRKLFAERGFEGTSIEEIASQAGVSKPVVYEHFGGKEGLYAVVVDREVERLLTTVTGLLIEADHSREKFEAGMVALLRYIETNADGFRILVRDSPPTSGSGTFGTLLSDIASQVDDIMAEFLKSRGRDPKLAPMYSQMMVGMVASTGQWWLDARKPKLEIVASNLIDVAWSGLARLETKELARPRSDSLGQPRGSSTRALCTGMKTGPESRHRPSGVTGKFRDVHKSPIARLGGSWIWHLLYGLVSIGTGVIAAATLGDTGAGRVLTGILGVIGLVLGLLDIRYSSVLRCTGSAAATAALSNPLVARHRKVTARSVASARSSGPRTRRTIRSATSGASASSSSGRKSSVRMRPRRPCRAAMVTSARRLSAAAPRRARLTGGSWASTSRGSERKPAQPKPGAVSPVTRTPSVNASPPAVLPCLRHGISAEDPHRPSHEAAHRTNPIRHPDWRVPKDAMDISDALALDKTNYKETFL
jgi:AcrR family transcriptional regulator